MSYQSQDFASNDPGFRSQVRQAVIAQAVAVANEPTGTANHTNRAALAVRLVNYLSDDQLTPWARAVSNDGTGTGSTDAVVLARVAALWTTFAGGY